MGGNMGNNIIELNQQEINCINGGYNISSFLAIGVVLFFRARGHVSNYTVGYLLAGIALANVPAIVLFGVVGFGVAYHALVSNYMSSTAKL